MIFSFSDFFVYLHHLIKGDSEFLLRHNELKAIYKTFTSSKFKYLTKDRYITQLFVNKMFQLLNNLFICFEFLDSTLFSNDENRKRVYTRFFIESFMSEENITILDKFTKEFIIKKLNDSDNPNKTISLIEADFIDFKKKINSESLAVVEKEYNFFKGLHHLSVFNYEGMFSKFDPSFSLKNLKAPMYTPVAGNEILLDLKDLYYIIATLPKKINVIESIRKLSTREKGPDAEAFAKKMQQAIDDIYKILQNDFTSDVILNMVRYIESNPKVKIRILTETTKIVEEYKKDLNDKFNIVKNNVIQQFSESTLQKDIKDLFKGRQLLSIEGYTDSLVDLLDKKNYDLKMLLAFRITKTFLLEVYEKKNKDIVNTFIIEGFFADKDFQKHFSDAFFKVNELKSYYLDLEKDIATNGSNSFKTLELLLASSSASNQNKSKKTLDVINERIMAINERVVSDFFTLGKMLYIALSEYKSQKPEKITNIRELKSGGNKEFITAIVNFYGGITKYIKLIKNNSK